MEIERGMLRSGPTAAGRLAAGAVLEDEGAAEQGSIGEELDGPGACLAFPG
jgi:hypothetical protein